MSQPQDAAPAKLVVGFLVADRSLAAQIIDALRDPFGPLDLVSPWLPFDYTDYYEREMGTPLQRRLLAFKNLVAQDRLAAFKQISNRVEAGLTVHGRRRANIDPGLLSSERFVLATGKNFSHRIYLGQGIYADLTLIYRHGVFQALPWTYPDYRDGDLHRFLNRVRCKLQRDLASRDAGRGNAPGTRNPKGAC
jgi:hypothetical protein